MHIIYICMISLANNIDNLGVRIAYSMLGIKINITKNLWISVITFAISFLAAFFGKLITGFLSKQISSEISAVILAAMGLWIILSPYLNKKAVSEASTSDRNSNWISNIWESPEKADIDCSKDIDFKEATLLGIALSINNIGGGLGAGIIGLNSVYVGIVSAIISFLALWVGNYMSAFFEKWNLGNKATTIAGIFMILIGIKQII